MRTVSVSSCGGRGVLADPWCLMDVVWCGLNQWRLSVKCDTVARRDITGFYSASKVSGGVYSARLPHGTLPLGASSMDDWFCCCLTEFKWMICEFNYLLIFCCRLLMTSLQMGDLPSFFFILDLSVQAVLRGECCLSWIYEKPVLCAQHTHTYIHFA